MSDQGWAVLIGAATVAALRVIDFFFPKGRWYTWGGRSNSDEDAHEDAELAKAREEDKQIAKKRRARDKEADDDKH